MNSFWADTSKPIAIAHRGGAGFYTVDRFKRENTLKVFQAAAGLGYEYLELDVTATSDNRAIVLHVTTDRFETLLHKPSAPNAKKLQMLTYEQLKIRLNRQIPTLGEMLIKFPKTKFLIDCKTDKAVEPIAKEVIKAKAYDRVYLNSFYIHRVAKLQEILGKKVTYGLVVGRYPRLINKKLEDLLKGKYSDVGLTAIVLPYRFINQKMVGFLHKEGLKVLVWTPNTEPAIQRCIDLRVDGIISDNVRLLKEMLDSRKAKK